MDEALVHSILENPTTAPINEQYRATLLMLERLTRSPGDFGPDDIAPVLAAGVGPDAIEEAMLVLFVFSLILRFVESFGFPSRTAEERKSLAKNLMRLGYALAAVPGGSRPGERPYERVAADHGSISARG